MCLAQGQNTVTPMRLEPATPQSLVKHSTMEIPFCLVKVKSLRNVVECIMGNHYLIWVSSLGGTFFFNILFLASAAILFSIVEHM